MKPGGLWFCWRHGTVAAQTAAARTRTPGTGGCCISPMDRRRATPQKKRTPAAADRRFREKNKRKQKQPKYPRYQYSLGSLTPPREIAPRTRHLLQFGVPQHEGRCVRRVSAWPLRNAGLSFKKSKKIRVRAPADVEPAKPNCQLSTVKTQRKQPFEATYGRFGHLNHQ